MLSMSLYCVSTTALAINDSPAILEFSVNGGNSGRQFVWMADDGDILVKPVVLEELRLRPALWADKVSAEQLVSLRSLQPVVTYQLEQAHSRLLLRIEPTAFEAQVISRPSPQTVARTPDEILSPAHFSAFANYRLSASSRDAYNLNDPDLYLEIGASLGQWFAFSNFNNGQRHESYLLWDRPEKLQRLRLGDVLAQSNGLTGSLGRLGGIAWSSEVALNKTLKQHPNLSLETQIDSPTRAELYVDDNLVESWDLQPGIVVFPDLPVAARRGNAVLLLTDAFGQETRIEQPFYFSGKLVPVGEHRYHYNLGFVREQGNDYSRNLAFNGYHRYGFSSSLTLAADWAWLDNHYVLSPSLHATFGSHSQWGLETALSRHQERTGYALESLYQFTPWGLTLNGGWYSRDFASLNNEQSTVLVQHQGDMAMTDDDIAEDSESSRIKYNFNLGWSQRLFKQFNVNINYGETGFYSHPDKARNRSLSVSFPWLKQWHINLGIRQRDSHWHEDTLLFASIRYTPKPQSRLKPFADTLAFNLRQHREADEYQFNLRKQQNNHYSYNAHINQRGDALDAQLYATYESPQARFTGSLKQSETQGSHHQISVAQGFGYADKRFGVGLPIRNSFALVKLEGEHKARVGYNGKLSAALEQDDSLLLSDLGSYQENHLYVVPEKLRQKAVNKDQYVTFKQRSGVAVNFNVVSFTSVQGMLHEMKAGQRQPLEFYQFHLHGSDGKIIAGFTGYEGYFYLEDLKPDTYRLRIERNSTTCQAEFQVANSDNQTTSSGELDVGALLCVLVSA